MRATGQARSLTGQLEEHERRLVAARAILGEWLGGSGGGWQDSGGVWLAMKPTKSAVVDRKTLMSRRDTLLAELAQLEARRREGSALPEKSERRRLRILNELEQIYSELDATVGPRGGGEGIAA